ncbi:PAS domain-containing sensor histidine kinase [Campylobacter devanensis]|uniref:PAS domain-containing sensor histidine kinase n=1 Tax=Campylobacter devanensis TaxID=3161138 RepID=UPI001EEFA009|nr:MULTISPECIES: PAS domain-containing sensor histidine kinase [unclassified Campylobacter]
MKLQQYQRAIDESNIVSKTDINGIITFVNDEFCKISGYLRDELIGQSHNIVRHPDVPAEYFKRLWETILNKKIYKGLIKNRTKDGKAVYLNTTIIPILDNNNEIEEFVAICYDITEMIELNERLMRAQNDLRKTKKLVELNRELEERVAIEVAKNEEQSKLMFQQSRLANMGEMLANISHQWRQPLNELSINLYKLKQSTKEPSSQFIEIYEHSKAVIKGMSSIIDNFRNFFTNNGDDERFSLKDAAQDAILMLENTFKNASIKLEIDIDDNIYIVGRQNEMAQIFINLFSNSKDAFFQHNIKDKRVNVRAYIQNDTNKQIKYAIITISDNAGGIEDSASDKLFDPYFTTKHPNVGTGLGLYIVRRIVSKLQGQISVSNLENGACFEIKIPLNGDNDE